ncbi:hypothetical protein MASR2M8_02970 [Opitutaceae bacterium]
MAANLASAATITWQNGSGTNNWNNTAQWSSGSTPGSGDTARFNANTSEDPIINGNYTVGQLLFTTGSDAEAFTGTNTLTLAGISGVGIDNQGTQTHTFANRFAITSSQVWRNTNATNGDMTFSNTLNLNANTLTLTNTNTVNTMSFSGVISGTGALSASGNGTLTLSGNNSYSGGTTLGAGTLTVANNNALGTGALAITGVSTLTASGSRTLANTVNASSDFTIGGTANLTLTGPINLGSGNRVLTVSNTGTTTFSGVVDNAYYANFTKAGNGRLVLSGNNTFDGSFLLNAGTVALQHSNALGSSTYGNVVASGATLEFSNNIAVSEGAFTLSGTGVSNVGALHNLSGNNSLAAQVTLGAATTIGSSAGTLTLSGQLDNAGNTLTVTGAGNLAFSGQIYGSGGLTKTGTGTVNLSGANSYTGATTISAGTLQISGANERISNDSDVSVASGATFDVNNLTETVGSITGAGNITLGTGTLRTNADNSSTTFSGVISGTGGTLEKIGSGTLTLSGANTYTGATNIAGGTLTLGASERLSNSTAVNVTSGATFNLAGFTETVGSIAGNANITLGAGSLLAGGDNTSTTFSGVISGTGGTLTKQGTGTMTLSGANTYTGLTTVSNGTLNIQNGSALGTSAAGTTVSSGATLALQGGITVADETLTLSGTGYNSTGALRNVADTNTWNGNVTLGGNTTIVSAGGQLNIGGSAISGIDTFSVGSNQLIFNTDGGNIDIRAGLTGSSPGTITKTGTGTLTLSGADNTFSGNYLINDGQVTLATPTYLGSYVNKGIQGDITIGDNTGAAGSASLVMSTLVPGNNRIADTVNVRVNSDGLFNLAGRSDAIAALTIQGGDVTTGVGTLDLGGNVSFLSSGREATISGFLGLGGVVRTIDVASGTSALISATINSGGYIKTGAGTLIVSANDASTYAGTTTIDGGILNVRGNLALGQGNSSTYSSRTEVNAGALELQNNVSIAGEYL